MTDGSGCAESICERNRGRGSRAPPAGDVGTDSLSPPPPFGRARTTSGSSSSIAFRTSSTVLPESGGSCVLEVPRLAAMACANIIASAFSEVGSMDRSEEPAPKTCSTSETLLKASSSAPPDRSGGGSACLSIIDILITRSMMSASSLPSECHERRDSLESPPPSSPEVHNSELGLCKPAAAYVRRESPSSGIASGLPAFEPGMSSITVCSESQNEPRSNTLPLLPPFACSWPLGSICRTL
mmetsp:Transcript_32467/g.92008  ORF Transcript_32467/g.92008 Transcript_32467/m.92008 type:complete len:241 (+) Transcript_32467:390-1112(+)